MTAQVYKDLCEKHPTFRERSETVDLSVEISLQPYRAFKPDGVILFSDILTPFSGMNIDFDIVQGRGPIIDRPVRTYDGRGRETMVVVVCGLRWVMLMILMLVVWPTEWRT